MKIRVITAALGLTVLAIFPAASAGASAQARPSLWNYVWTPGTALPKIGANEVLDAWPVQSVLGKLKVAQSVPLTKIGYTTPKGVFVRAASAAAIRNVTAAGGLVNLQAAPQTCGAPQLVQKLGLRWVAVATTFSLISYVTQDFDYSEGQSSTLEVGESASGKSGSLSEDGSVSVSSTADQGFPATNRGNERYLTEFAFGKYKVKCAPGGHVTPAEIVHYYEVKPYEWAGGDSMQHPKTAPRATYCVVERANSKHSVTFTKHSTKAISFSAGFSILGFSGFAQTGYDTNAKVSFTWAKKTSGHLCGTADYPAGAPREMVAKR